MSDSDSDVLANDFPFRRERTEISMKGPNINTTTLTNFTFHNNDRLHQNNMSNMQWNIERPRNTESLSHQRREMSPLSLRSAPGMQSRNFLNSHYYGMSSQRSMFNERSGSPMSVRTTDTNMSLSAQNIALALTTVDYDKFDLRIIQNAFKYMKHRFRKRIDKRRNWKTSLKHYRRRSDSGDQASDSSISSDDQRTVISSRTAIFNDNVSCKSIRSDKINLRTSMKTSGMYPDITDDNRFCEMLPGPAERIHNNPQPSFGFSKNRAMTERDRFRNMPMTSQNYRSNDVSMMVQNNRFKNSVQTLNQDWPRNRLLLPSQRFNTNQSVASLTIAEVPNTAMIRPNSRDPRLQNQAPNKDAPKSPEENTDQEEEIFSRTTSITMENRNQYKRNLEHEDMVSSDKKRYKMSSPKKVTKNKTPKRKQSPKVQSQNIAKANDFQFAKPQLPIKKTSNVKILRGKSHQTEKLQNNAIESQTPLIVVTKPQQVNNIPKPVEPVEHIIAQSHPSLAANPHSPEKLISKSAQSLDPEPKTMILSDVQNIHEKNHDDTHSTTDMSMRPSFIKRKLFTQKVDQAEKSGNSDTLGADSPQSSIYSKIQKEKNRARKLVSQSSCLSRDLGDDRNLIDLIHKIVPPDRLNLTKANNRSENLSNKSKPNNNDDKWETTEVISNKKDGDLSDTYTDEEIFNNTRQKNPKNNDKQSKVRQNKSEKTSSKPDVQSENNNTKPSQRQENTPKKGLLVNNNDNKKGNKQITKKIETQKPMPDIKNSINAEKNNKPTLNKQKNAPQKVTQEKDSVEQNVDLPINNPVQTNMDVTVNSPNRHLLTTTEAKKAYNLKEIQVVCVKNFWDTDVESDFEATPFKNPVKGAPLLNKSSAPTQVPLGVHQRSESILSSTVQHTTPTDKTSNAIIKNQCLENVIEKSQAEGRVGALNIANKENVIKGKPNTKSSKIGAKNLYKDETVNKKPTTAEPSRKTPKVNNSEIKFATANKPTKDLDKNDSKSKLPSKKIILDNNNSNEVKPTYERAKKQEEVTETNYRTRQIRKPAVKKCCLDNQDESFCRSLRSREIDLSNSFSIDSTNEKNTKTRKPTQTKPLRQAKAKKVQQFNEKENDPSQSDLSFTLTSESYAERKAVVTKLKDTKQSDMLKDNSPNSTVRRRMKEVEMLHLGAASFFKSGKNTTMATGNLNRTSRLNRTKVCRK